MRTINIYKFGELPQEARDRVRSWYLNGLDQEAFERSWVQHVESKLPDSHIAVAYGSKHGADDVAAIYGTVSRIDLLNLIRGNLTPDEQETLWALWALCSQYEYEYCAIPSDRACDQYDYVAGMPCDNAASRVALDKFNRLAQEAMAGFRREIEADGRSYFYEIDDASLASWCEVNGYEFSEDGELY